MLKFLRSFFSTALTDFDDRGRVVELRRSSEGAVLEHAPASTEESEQQNGDGTKRTTDVNDQAKDGQPESKKPRTIKERLIKCGRIVFSVLFLVGICAVLVYFIWALSSIASAWLAVPRWIGFVVTLLLLWFVPKLWRHTAGKITPSHDPYQIMILVEYVRNSICPGCFYRLDESLTEPDGCTICPECGAAWNISFWKREHQLPKMPANNVETDIAKKLYLEDARGFPVKFLGNRSVQERLARIEEHKKAVSPELHLSDAVKRSIVVKIASEMVASSLCPCCEATLGSELTWRDGLRLCQTCHAAWLPDGNVEPWSSKRRWNVNVQ